MVHSVSRQSIGNAGQGASGPAGGAAPRASVRRRGPSPTARRQRRAAFLFLAPACVMVAVYVVWPILSTIRISFFNWDGMTDPSFVGLANYV
ncbi:MAG: sugar ABC transporter permease, partial [Paraburkholderia sp.]